MATYNRYYGNSGRVERRETRPAPNPQPQSVPRPVPQPARSAPQPVRPPQRGGFLPFFQGGQRQSAPGSGKKPGGLLGSLTEKLDLSKLETEDVILLLILYLLYRESGDEELLIMMGAMFLL